MYNKEASLIGAAVMQQVSFEDITWLNRNRKTRKQKFLGDMDEAVPWSKVLAVIEPY